MKKSGDVFLAWSDEPWIVDGAAVRVSIVGQDDGTELDRSLNGVPAKVIRSDLSGGDEVAVDVTTAKPLIENRNIAFQGDSKGGSFELDAQTARSMLVAPPNVNQRPNSEVIVPWINGNDVVRRPQDRFIIDFADLSEREAAQYELPFEHVRKHVLPVRVENRRAGRRDRWWRHAEIAVSMRAALAGSPRFLVTPRVAKWRLFIWAAAPTLPDTRLVAVCRPDDYVLGLLQSRVHEIWSLRTGGWHGVGNDPQYTPTSSFETFPFPWPLNTPDEALTEEQAGHRDAIGAAAKALDEARQRWLNPPELVRLEPDVIPSLPLRFVPVSEEAAKQLAKRTLTNLYNQRPAWLDHLHRDLDRAVFAAYGWPDDIEEEEMLRRLLALNLERAEAQA
ncbi:MAG: type IIL restriction-modification enzyme MmeI [Dehalococcoidia bacterium]